MAAVSSWELAATHAGAEVPHDSERLPDLFPAAFCPTEKEAGADSAASHPTQLLPGAAELHSSSPVVVILLLRKREPCYTVNPQSAHRSPSSQLLQEGCCHVARSTATQALLCPYALMQG